MASQVKRPKDKATDLSSANYVSGNIRPSLGLHVDTNAHFFTYRQYYDDVCRLVPVEEASVVIAISSVHRNDSLEAVHYCIDALKASVPIWKQVTCSLFFTSYIFKNGVCAMCSVRIQCLSQWEIPECGSPAPPKPWN